MYDSFWSKVDARGVCWQWIAGTDGRYGLIKHEGSMQLAHRVAYKILVGPISRGLVIDHLCRNKLCVNPDHLEPVTQSVNVQRGALKYVKRTLKTHCKRDHLLDEENVYLHQGKRHCRACRKAAKNHV